MIAAGADAGDEVDLAVGIFIDLGAGGLKWALGVRRVDKLAGDEAVRDLRGQLVGLGDGALHALGAFGQDELGAIGAS